MAPTPTKHDTIVFTRHYHLCNSNGIYIYIYIYALLNTRTYMFHIVFEFKKSIVLQTIVLTCLDSRLHLNKSSVTVFCRRIKYSLVL